MGNASVFKRDEAEASGAKNEEDGVEYMEYAHGSYHAPTSFSDFMLHSPPHSPRAYHPPLGFTPQVICFYYFSVQLCLHFQEFNFLIYLQNMLTFGGLGE